MDENWNVPQMCEVCQIPNPGQLTRFHPHHRRVDLDASQSLDPVDRVDPDCWDASSSFPNFLGAFPPPPTFDYRVPPNRYRPQSSFRLGLDISHLSFLPLLSRKHIFFSLSLSPLPLLFRFSSEPFLCRTPIHFHPPLGFLRP